MACRISFFCQILPLRILAEGERLRRFPDWEFERERLATQALTINPCGNSGWHMLRVGSGNRAAPGRSAAEFGKPSEPEIIWCNGIDCGCR